jgi:ribosomal subunit interface protein
MNKKINFHNMDYSEALEAHALKKLKKLEEFCSDAALPLHAELWLKAESSHPHHKTDLQVRVNKTELHTSSESRDLYVAIDEAIDKMVVSLKKAKDIQITKDRYVDTEKRKFTR